MKRLIVVKFNKKLCGLELHPDDALLSVVDAQHEVVAHGGVEAQSG